MKIDLTEIKAEEKQKENQQLILDGNEIKIYNLNQGQYKNKFYFGKKIQIGTDLLDSIIFEDGKIFVDYTPLGKENENQIEGVGLAYNNPLLSLENSWSKTGISNYLSAVSVIKSGLGIEGDKKEQKKDKKFENQNNNNNNSLKSKHTRLTPTPPTTYTNYTNYTTTTLTLHLLKKNLLKDLITLQNHYMDVPQQETFLLTSCYIISTYLYTLFPATGYLFFHSTSGSGKTKFADIISFLSFNSVNATSPSESVLFRIIEQTKGLMVVDDFENLPDERKNVLEQILKVGYRRGGKTSRSEKIGKNWVPVFFDVYCPKIITNTIGLDLITLSRCIPIHLMKTKSVKGRLGVHPESLVWRDLRDACYAFALFAWREIEEAYWSLDVPELNNRDLELVKPVLAVAKVFGAEWFDKLKAHLLLLLRERDIVELSDSWEFILFDVIRDFCVENEGEHWVPVGVLLNRMKLRMDWSNDEAHPSAHWIGTHLSGVPVFRKRRVGKGTEYFVSLARVEEYMASRGFIGAIGDSIESGVVKQDIRLLDGDFCLRRCDFCGQPNKEIVGVFESETQRKFICEPCYDKLGVVE